MLRAARRTRGVSQRELAERADVPRSTVDRIEAGSSKPKIETVEVLLDALGYELVVCTRRGRLLTIDPEAERLTDRADRHFPAHWEFEPTGPGWWGWSRVAWWSGDRWAPEHTYWRRRPSSGFTPWEDAT